MNHSHLRIITNSLRVAHILYKNTEFEVMVPGGTLRPNNGGIIGPSAVSFVEGFRADYLITSVGAIEANGDLLEFDVNESSVVKAMMAHSRHILLAADHTKFHASAAVEIGNTRQATALFTDMPPPCNGIGVTAAASRTGRYSHQQRRTHALIHGGKSADFPAVPQCTQNFTMRALITRLTLPIFPANSCHSHQYILPLPIAHYG